MKILFVLPLLSGIGGIQSSIQNLLNLINPENDISLCVFGNHISESTFIPSNVKVIKGPRILEYCLRKFDSNVGSYSLPEKGQFIVVKLLKKLLGYEKMMLLTLTFYKIQGDYDVAISYANDIYHKGFVGGSNYIVEKCVVADRKIAWIHNDPQRLGFTYDICKRTYKNFDCIVNVSYACKKIFDQIIPDYSFKSKVVNNTINFELVNKKAEEYNPYNPTEFNLVTVARLDNRQKRIDRLIDCCEIIKTNGYRNFKWYVVGDGPDEMWLKRRIKEKGLEDTIVFTGRKSNPYPYMKFADILVMTSDYEAHSMVLNESLAVGTPVICTNYPAAGEVIRSGFNGELVDVTIDGITNAIKRVLLDKNIIQGWRENIASKKMGNELAITQFWNAIKGSDE